MQKVDRLGWAAGFSFSAYGVLIGVRSNDPVALADLRERVPFGSDFVNESEVEYVYSIVRGGQGLRAGTRRYHLIYADAAQIGRTLDWAQLLEGFEKDLELFVGERARGRVFVHAGVVEWKERAIVLPGRSRSGKSTLVAQLVRAGARYSSDEFAILDARGDVHPFRRPIALRDPLDAMAPKVTPSDLLARPVLQPIPVGCVLLTAFRASARFRPVRITPGTACLEILRHTLCARTQPELALPVIGAVVERAPTYRSPRGRAEDVAEAVLALVD